MIPICDYNKGSVCNHKLKYVEDWFVTEEGEHIGACDYFCENCKEWDW